MATVYRGNIQNGINHVGPLLAWSSLILSLLVMQGFPGASLAGSAPEFVPAMEPDNPEIKKVATESSTSSWKLPNIHSFAGPLGVYFNLFTQVDGATFHHDASGEFNDDVVLRRLRLTFQRTLIRHWTFKGSAELNAGEFELKDMYGLYTGFPHASIFAGNQKEPFSLEQMTSSRFTTLMERSMSNTFSPQRSLGVSVHTRTSRSTAVAGVFAGGLQQGGRGQILT